MALMRAKLEERKEAVSPLDYVSIGVQLKELKISNSTFITHNTTNKTTAATAATTTTTMTTTTASPRSLEMYFIQESRV